MSPPRTQIQREQAVSSCAHRQVQVPALVGYYKREIQQLSPGAVGSVCRRAVVCYAAPHQTTVEHRCGSAKAFECGRHNACLFSAGVVQRGAVEAIKTNARVPHAGNPGG